MNLLDPSQKPRGIFALDIYRRGQLIEHFEDDNLIVTKGRESVVRLVAGDVASRSVVNIGFGTNGTAANPADTALTGAFVKAIDSHSYPVSTSVQFNFSLATSEAIGLSIREFGLLTSSGILHARKVRGGPLLKDIDISLSGTWTLIY